MIDQFVFKGSMDEASHKKVHFVFLAKDLITLRDVSCQFKYSFHKVLRCVLNKDMIWIGYKSFISVINLQNAVMYLNIFNKMRG